jgi:ATP-dependent RNA helicase RhlB
MSSPKSGDSLEDRLAYYRQKYGEDFQPTDEMLASMDGGGRKSGSAKKSSSGNRAKKRPQSEKASAGGEKTGAEHSSKQDAQEKDHPKESKKGVLGALRSFFGG